MTSRLSSSTSLKQRQLSHLNSQVAQLQANLSDLENLVKITSIQAEYIKKIGIMHGSLFMASHKVFEDETMKNQEVHEDSTDLPSEIDQH